MANLKNLNRFEWAPVSLDIQRSRFHMPHQHKTTFKSGLLVPIGLFEVLPSDTFEIDFSSVVRMLTPVVPTMDNCFLDVYAFYVPNRIACAHAKDWEKICGENVDGFWAPTNEATLSNTGNTVDIHNLFLAHDSVGAYYGLPIFDGGFPNIEISLLPLRGYVNIFNEWFRDQNTQPPVDIGNYSYEDSCLNVNKLHDYFTSCLPSPQKGASVLLPLGDLAPVVLNGGSGLVLENSGGTVAAAGDLSVNTSGTVTNGQALLKPRNLVADLSSATAATINELRQAFAIQRMLEKDARGGSRYREILRTHYGSSIPDNTVQIPQYLGGKRVPLNITQVLQTSSSDEASPLGATGAFSNTSISDKLFTKSFDEHGFIHILACVRPNQTYSQGISKMWTRNRRYDWYYPSFANLGEQVVFARELYALDSGMNVDQVFGYNEAWAEYRYLPNRVSGLLAPNANDLTLTPWTYTNNFSAVPVLNSSFMVQNSAQIGDTLVFQDSNYQFIADFYFDISATRAMPIYSVPGLIDHH